MAIRCDEYNHVGVVSIDGDLSGVDAAALQRTVEDLAAQRGLRSVVVDLDNTRFIDGEGLASLLGVRRQVTERSGQLKLAGLDENCRKILEMTRLLRRFECHPDLASALKAVA